ncbi:angiogenic factor with G patch and FHA domains 1 isoform X2 [Bactrocera dorsalis]|uniref:Angiogenic factor with G patch and FHA domains 1 isoform X2 n=1 Tax=Bactrocera dorsalis TaxID=27457 RepID=A0A8N4KX24_BACDO|nr:angiogenic factor with G patch and FHA domains 1 isoform X2 [Bactrocera dorsalis]
MSDSESDSNAKQTKSSGAKFKLKKLDEIEKLESGDICAYICELHELLIKKDNKIKKYKDKYKEILRQLNDEKENSNSDKPTNSASIETNSPAPIDEKPAVDNAAATTVDNFVDDIRRAAEQAQNLNGFVYEPTSGLYYDQKTGYYYNAEYGLYYDGNNGCYYNYNQEKNVFEFHSQVQAQQNQKAAEDDFDADEMVAFDEFGGVITDQERLRKIKEERRQEQEDERMWRRKKKSKSTKAAKSEKHAKSKKRKHKSKKRKRARKHKRASSDSSATDDESDEQTSNRKRKKRVRRRRSCDVEDGELSESSSSSDSSRSESDSEDSRSSGDVDRYAEEKEGKGVATFAGGGRFQDIAKKYPPSLRIIVQESNLEALKVGSLSLITYKGGSLGREGNHDVIIPDVNVSKLHMRFHYDHKQSIYKCTDLGSRNGTVLNGTRMSASKQESTECDLVHGSVLQIGQTKLLCHVHEGNSTCGLCEPGLLIETARESSATAANTTVLTHREQLKKLQKKYGLEKEKFVEGKQNAGSYNDRAATRRIQVGSSTDGEKTQAASVNTEISSDNKGFKMLSKLGWNKGEALGKASDGSGLLEPINVASNEGKTGLGCGSATSVSVALTNADKRKIATWKKTQARYQQTDIFEDSDNSS